uniref:DUF4062 domain-containing protein n=1 Tax=Callorhinchus milii TaxID=7868 RepID=A0A4W3J3A2_CALMI
LLFSRQSSETSLPQDTSFKPPLFQSGYTASSEESSSFSLGNELVKSRKSDRLLKQQGNQPNTEHESNALMEKVYPRLNKYCKERGYDFKMVDLRWGVKNGICDNHTTAQLHLDVLKECQMSEGSNFIVSGTKMCDNKNVDAEALEL